MKTVSIFVAILLATASVALAQACGPERSGEMASHASIQVEPAARFTHDNPRLEKLVAFTLASGNPCAVLRTVGIPAAGLHAAEGTLLEILYQEWLESAWMNDKLSRFTFGPDGMVDGALTQVYENGEWVNQTLDFVEFDENGLLVSTVEQVWVDGAWVNSFRQTNDFDADGVSMGFLFEIWDNDAWVGDLRSVSTRATDGLLAQTLIQMMEDGEWRDVSRTDYTYDAMSQLEATSLWVYDETAMTLQNVSRNLYTYPDELTRISTRQVLVEDDMGAESWIDLSRITTYYDGDAKEVLSTSEQFIVDWVFTSRRSSTYNDAGQRTEYITQSWRDTEWVNTFATFDTYDADGDILESLEQTWDGTAWMNDYREESHYGEPIAISDDGLPLRAVAMSVYPSPARDQVQIVIEADHALPMQIEVYDVLGRRIARLLDDRIAGMRQLSWDASAYPPGMYFVRLRTDQREEIRPLVVAR
ncbi:MAG: T9SS type A sorting domain-containing protein [Rhodothermales bacterium]